MDTELESMLDRADELLSDLEEEYKRCLQAQKITQRAKNLSHEVLEKLRHALDHAMRRAWERYVAPNLSEGDRERARVYFPICSDLKSFRSTLGYARVADLDQAHPKSYNFLLKKQPFIYPENQWLAHLTKIAGEGKHVRLAPQKAIEKVGRIKVSRPGHGEASWDPSKVKFGAGKVEIMGAPVDPSTQRIVPTPGVNEQVEIWVAFTFEGYGLNALGFCKEACQKTRALIQEMVKTLQPQDVT